MAPPQLAAVAPRVADWGRVVLAYELGTGETATPANAQRALATIRKWIRFGFHFANYIFETIPKK